MATTPAEPARPLADMRRPSTSGRVPWAEPIAPCHRRAVERVIGTLHERLDAPHTLETLAATALLSPYYFHRIFRDATGVPPRRFLSALRIEAAKRLLLTTDLRVTDVCLAVGYHSLGTFTSQFSRLVGVSPRGLRKAAASGAWPDLTELLGEHGAEPSERGPEPRRRVHGELRLTEGTRGGVAFLGLFPSVLPEGRPAGCTLAPAPGPFAIDAARDGRFYVLAAVLPPGEDFVDYLLPDDGQPVARTARPIQVPVAGTMERVELTLAPRRPIDPPVLLCPAGLAAADGAAAAAA